MDYKRLAEAAKAFLAGAALGGSTVWIIKKIVIANGEEKNELEK